MKFLLDLGPLIAFFGAYKLYGLSAATAVLIGTTLISVVLMYLIYKKIHAMPLISALVIGIFGGLTIILHNELFIKIKPTIVNLIFASILIGGAFFKKGMLQYLLGDALPMTDRAWRVFSLRWGIFFVFLAVVNEIVWRNFPTETWVEFKVFGMFTMSMAFTLAHVPFLKKHMVEKGD